MMEQEIKTASEIYNISRQLSMENKKYVIAVANALLFSQGYKKDENCRVSANCSVRAEWTDEIANCIGFVIDHNSCISDDEGEKKTEGW